MRVIPVTDRAWLLAALADALAGGAPILPVVDEGGGAGRLREAAILPGTAVVVRTTGSSGRPKAVALGADALRSSARAAHEALGGAGQWVLALPAHLIGGLQVLVRSAETGIDPVFVEDPGDAHAMLADLELADHGRRYLALVPVQFRRLLALAEQDRGAADALRELSAILVGGQALPLELRGRAHALGLPLVRSYGMTETAGGCVYDGLGIGDTRVRIRGGEVQLAGSSLALGYLGDPELTAERFVAEHGTRWYRSGDAGELLGGVLRVSGRLDRVIVSGGVNVSLDEIERVAGELPGWAGVVALGVEDPEWGERPVLVVERDPEAADPLDLEALRSVVRTRLGAAAMPERAVECDRLPRLPGGKPDVSGARALLD